MWEKTILLVYKKSKPYNILGFYVIKQQCLFYLKYLSTINKRDILIQKKKQERYFSNIVIIEDRVSYKCQQNTQMDFKCEIENQKKVFEVGSFLCSNVKPYIKKKKNFISLSLSACICLIQLIPLLLAFELSGCFMIFVDQICLGFQIIKF